VGGAALTYSTTANLTTDAQGRMVVYDAWNRLVSVYDSSSTLVARYEYDGMNRRIVEQAGTLADSDATTAPVRDLFYSLQWQVLEERVRDGSGDIPAEADTRYIWSPVYVDAVIARDRNADGDSGTGTGGLEERVYAIQDANWNTTAIIAATGVSGFSAGDVINRFVYTPYGEYETLDAAWDRPTSAPATPWSHLFQGLKLTEITSLFYVRHRDYSASVGRFIERDPIGFDAGDNNWYRFVGNQPVSLLDPTGLADSSRYGYPPITRTVGASLWLGSMYFAMGISITQKEGTYERGGTCCVTRWPNGTVGPAPDGTRVSVDYSADVSVYGIAAKAWSWNFLGIGLIRGGVSAAFQAAGRGAFDVSFEKDYCLGLHSERVCSNSTFWITVQASAVGWVYFAFAGTLSASIAGAYHIPARICSDFDPATGRFTNFGINVIGPTSGAIELRYGWNGRLDHLMYGAQLF